MNSKSKISLRDLLKVEKEELENLRARYLEMSNLRIAFYDLDAREISDRSKGQHPYCNLIQKGEGGLKQCMKFDKELCEKAIQEGKPVIGHCFAKAVHFAFPIELNSRVIGTCMGGAVFIRRREKRRKRNHI